MFNFPSLASPKAVSKNVSILSAGRNATITAGAENYVLLYGNFDHFVLVHRFPSSVEFIPNLFGPNGRPTGQRGFFLWARTGSDVLVPNAFRVLNVT